jgi:hypothetical protein
MAEFGREKRSMDIIYSWLPYMLSAASTATVWLLIVGAAYVAARLLRNSFVIQTLVWIYVIAGLVSTAPIVFKIVTHAGEINVFGSRLGEAVVHSAMLALLSWLFWPLLWVFFLNVVIGTAPHILVFGPVVAMVLGALVAHLQRRLDGRSAVREEVIDQG